ncbi:MAG: glycosyltransferase family 39 protein, partial [Verrucomicrobia bacterium]|nr:glycosyltransferase family 39 protein [Verrucomicrobiota bacterium]
MRNEKLRDCFWIILAGALAALTLRPFQDTPLIDDWTYAWAVEWLLKHSQLRMLDWCIHINPVHVVWGWLFCLPAGFSFVALRLSTFVSAVACVCGVYAVLRELEVSRRDALIGAAVLGLNPIFFFLAISFMTDVPFLALTVWAAWAMVRALRERSNGWLVAASALAALARGVRR